MSGEIAELRGHAARLEVMDLPPGTGENLGASTLRGGRLVTYEPPRSAGS
jgi:hypothetical protein